MASVEAFKSHILDAGILDPEGIHHEFVSGKHGRKLDFDTIPTDSPLYKEWVEVTADFLGQEFPELPEVVIGVANGANRLAMDTAQRFNNMRGVTSEKDVRDGTIRLSTVAFQLCAIWKPRLVVLEDAGTTGSNSVQVAKRGLGAGARSVEVVTTWQRRPILERLVEQKVDYRAIIDEPLDTFSPEECRESGHCAEGWKFIPYRRA